MDTKTNAPVYPNSVGLDSETYGLRDLHNQNHGTLDSDSSNYNDVHIHL